jgi:hypothetical protein
MRRAEKALPIAHFSRDFSLKFTGWICIEGDGNQGKRLRFSEIEGK